MPVNKKVLIIEDDAVQVRLLTVRLKAAGFDVAVASDAVQSVGAVRRERPDIVLLDIGLPGGDGYVVLKRLKALVHISAVPIIAVSGRAADTERERMLSAGADDYFEKPVNVDRLAARMRELLGGDSLAATA